MWQEHCAALWGADWIAPCSEVLDINRRTIERWRAEGGEPPQHITTDIADLACRAEAREIGTLLRRLVAGESFKALDQAILRHKIALEHLRMSEADLVQRAIPFSDMSTAIA